MGRWTIPSASVPMRCLSHSVGWLVYHCSLKYPHGGLAENSKNIRIFENSTQIRVQEIRVRINSPNVDLPGFEALEKNFSQLIFFEASTIGCFESNRKAIKA